MIDGLTVINLKKGTTHKAHNAPVFTLATCQRTIVLGMGQHPKLSILDKGLITAEYQGIEAYQFLLETISGLQSEVLAEYEIVNQFRTAYKEYLKNEHKNPHIISLIEKLFKDQKQVRSEHLKGIGQESYAGLIRKIILEKNATKKILILGTGQLATEASMLLMKKCQISITGRNTEKAIDLARKVKGNVIPWMDLLQFEKFDVIINTIGTDEILLNESFFSKWTELHLKNKLFVDVGSPSTIKTELNYHDSVYRLEDLFLLSQNYNEFKKDKINNALIAINEITKKRQKSFSMSIPFGWEELQFA
jgi:glutamyl-tRNA reductase